MYNLEKALEPKCYEFHWEVLGYDCCTTKVTSPTFRVNFEVTDWEMVLDLAELKIGKCSIPFCLKRKGDIGPSTITFDVAVGIEIRGVTREKEKTVTFDKETDSYTVLLEVPPSPDSDWSAGAQSLWVHLKMKSSHADEFLKGYWYTKKSLKTVEENLEDLHSNAYFHDASFRVADKEFTLHKCILNARWPKLASTLKLDKPSSLADAKDLSGVSPTLLEKLFKFAYCGNLKFMCILDRIQGGMDVFNLVRKHNFYRLNNSITQLSSVCESTQMFQSYRTTVHMVFSHFNLHNLVKRLVPIGDFRTCDIPLKPQHIPKSEVPMTPEALEKYQRHIKFMDIRLYVEKGPLGFNWLKYSIVLGKIPEENPVTIMCRLFVLKGTEELRILLSDQTHVFKEGHSGFQIHTFKTPFSEGKVSKRYQVTSQPVITWDDLTDRSKELMLKSKLSSLHKDGSLSPEEPSSKKARPSKEGSSSQRDPSPKEEACDLYFAFDLIVTDGEYIHDERHGECIFEYKWDHKLFEDLKSMCGDKFTDVEVTDKEGLVKVQAHKAVLAARSKVLKSELENKLNRDPLKLEIEPDCLEMFVHYLYTGLIPEVPTDKIDHLRAMGVKYELECLGEVLDKERNGTNGAANGSGSSS